MVVSGTNMLNGSLLAYNSVTQKSLVVTSGMSDLKIVAGLCTDYHFFVLSLTAATMLMFFAKGTLHRLAKRKPYNKDLAKLRDSADGLIEVFLIMFTVIQFVIALIGWMG